MYAHGMSGLGDDAIAITTTGPVFGPPAPPAEQSWMTGVSNFLQQAATTGASVYSKIQSITMQQKAAEQAQANQNMLTQFQLAQRMQAASSTFGGWGLPILLGVGAIGVIWYLRK